MPLPLAIARPVCTDAELELFTESLNRNVKRFSAQQLKSRIARSRELRDKYRQRADRQDREARGKQASRGRRPSQGSTQTRRKAQLFAETLDRFEQRHAKLEPPKPAKKKVVKKKATKKKSVAKKTTAPARKKPTTKKAAKKARKTASGRTRIEKHLSAQGRRRQARRDSR